MEEKLLKSWRIELSQQVKPKQIFFAYDTPYDLHTLEHATKLFKYVGYNNRNLLSYYVLIVSPGNSFALATKRLEIVNGLGFSPIAILYRYFKGDPTPDLHRFQRS